MIDDKEEVKTMDRYDAILKDFVNGTQHIYGNLLNTIILYGSVAKGTDVADSDIDLVVLVNNDNEISHEALIDFIVDLELECGKVLSVLVISQNDYTRWNSVVPFYKNVKEEGVVLWTAA